MTKEEFLEKVNVLKSGLKMGLSFGTESLGEFCIGYFYDEKESNWKVFVNYDRTLHHIALVTENESEVYDKVIALILYNTEREKWCIGTYSGK